MTDSNSRPVVWMLCGAFLFSVMSALTHELGTRCDWLVVALVRALFMFGSMVISARLAGVRLVVWNPRKLWTRSLAGSFSLVCNFYALTRLPVADAITLSNTYPLWIVVLAWWQLRRLPSALDVLSVAAGTAGVVLIQQPHLANNDSAALVALLSSVSTAIALIGLHRLKEVDYRAVMAHFAGVASLISIVGFLAHGGTRTLPPYDPITLVLLVGVGLTGTAGQVFLTKAYAAGAPARVSVVGLSQVAFAMGFDVILWGRSLTPLTLVGFTLVLAPTAWLLSQTGRRMEAERHGISESES
jgi:drug/metabolite transporter (DMT)-like permease